MEIKVLLLAFWKILKLVFLSVTMFLNLARENQCQNPRKRSFQFPNMLLEVYNNVNIKEQYFDIIKVLML